jgi:hypothetical protein
MDTVDLCKLDSLLDGAINVVVLVEKNAGRLTDDQRYFVVMHCLFFLAWVSRTEENETLDQMAAYLAVVTGHTKENQTFEAMNDYLVEKYGVRKTDGTVSPIQQFIDDLRDLNQQVEGEAT